MKLRILGLTLLSLVAVFFAVLPQDIMLYTRFYRAMNSRKQAATPPQNTPPKPHREQISLPKDTLSFAHTQTRKPNSAFVLIFVGDCASCLAIDVTKIEKQAQKSSIPLLFVSSAKPEKIRKFQKDYHVQSPFLLDPQNKLYNLLQVEWLGQAFVISSKGSIVWVQTEQRLDYDMFGDSQFTHAFALGGLL